MTLIDENQLNEPPPRAKRGRKPKPPNMPATHGTISVEVPLDLRARFYAACAANRPYPAKPGDVARAAIEKALAELEKPILGMPR